MIEDKLDSIEGKDECLLIVVRPHFLSLQTIFYEDFMPKRK